MVNYLLITGIVLLILGILMKLRKIDFLLDRFQFFHKNIRKEDIEVRRDRLATLYSYLYIMIATLLVIGGIIVFVDSANSDKINLWTAIVAIILGIGGILYCNLSKSIINPKEQVES
jgi:hypothetical protein